MMRRWPFLRSFRPGQVRADDDQDIHEEIELYLELRTEELVGQGLGPEEARRVAERRFGDAKKIESELKDEARRRRARGRRSMTMGSLRQDIAFALRTFWRRPGFALVAVVTLALALGGNTAIFSVFDAAVLRALPFDDSEELVFVNGYHLVDGQISIRGASFPEFRDWAGRSRTFASMAAVGGMSFTLTGDGQAERVNGEIVTERYFDVLGVAAEAGRTFTPDEHAEPDAHSVVLISHALYERRFASDPAVVGRSILINDRPLTVVGVMPAGFGGTSLNADIWVPESLISLVAGPSILESRGTRFLSVIGRLGDGETTAVAQRELDVIAGDLQADFPEAHEDRFAQVQEFREAYLGSTGGLLWILLGAGVVLLLIAAANVANLQLVRSHARTRELVLRRALGAGGGRVASQLMVESLVLAGAGGVLGLGLAAWCLGVLGPMIPAGVLPGYVEPRLSRTAFMYSLGALVFVGVVTGLVPAVASSSLDIASRLREGAKSVAGTSLRRLRAQHVFVVAQVALALVLTVGAGLLTRSFRAQLAVDVGSQIDRVEAMSLQLPRGRYDTSDEMWRFARDLEDRLAAIPGVVHASVSSDLPFRGGASASYIYKEGAAPEDRIRYYRHSVTPGYFDALGVEVVEGRPLTSEDVDEAPGAIVITDAMARRVYPGESAVGKVMALSADGSNRAEIVGVVADVRYRNLTTSLMAEANSPDVFFSYWQIPSRSLEVAVRTQGDPSVLAPRLRRAVAELDPDLPVYQLQPLVDAYVAQTATPRFAAFLMGLFSSLAVVLACVGIYGVLAFAVGQRTRELAIRRAIGARSGTLAGSVVGEGLKLAAIGLAVGGVGSALASRLLETFLFGVTATDPATFAAVGAGMVAIAALAALVPAMRAMAGDPSEALNSE